MADSLMGILVYVMSYFSLAAFKKPNKTNEQTKQNRKGLIDTGNKLVTRGRRVWEERENEVRRIKRDKLSVIK